MNVFVLTGTPGTGKSSLAKKLEKKGYLVIKINDIIKLHRIWVKKEKGAKVVNISKLRNILIKEIKRNMKNPIVVEGHLACEFNLPVEFCIVLRTDPLILFKRMSKRNYPKYKIVNNIEAEFIDYCTQLSEKNYSCPVYELDSSSTISKSFKKLIDLIELAKDQKTNRKKLEMFRPGKINWSSRINNKLLRSFLFQ